MPWTTKETTSERGWSSVPPVDGRDVAVVDLPPPAPPSSPRNPRPANAAEDGATVDRFPCGQCGATLTFKPGADALTCEFCGHVNPIARGAGEIRELDYYQHLKRLADSREIEESRTIGCGTCGAEYTLGPDAHAGACPYCGSQVITDTGVNRHVKPGGVLPFAIDEAAARAAMAKWLAGLWFAPSDLKKFARSSGAMDGVYMPYWTYDSDTTSRYTGERGDSYTTYETVTVTQNGQSRQVQRPVRRIRWTSASGSTARFFDDVLVPASQSLPRKYLDGLEPWDLGDLKPYAAEYLSGFAAEAYQVDLSDGFDRARTIMNAVIRKDVAASIGGDAQRIHHVDTRHNDVTFKHILLPVWIAAYRYRDKPYRFVVNARTGAVKGARPWSWTKIALAVVAGAILAGGALFLGAQQGMFDNLGELRIEMR